MKLLSVLSQKHFCCDHIHVCAFITSISNCGRYKQPTNGSKTKTNNLLRSKRLISLVEDEPTLTNALVNELPGREEEYLPASFMEWSVTKSILGVPLTIVIFN